MAESKIGLSKKTNVAIAAVAGIATARESFYAIIAITVIALVCVAIQGYLDRKKQ